MINYDNTIANHNLMTVRETSEYLRMPIPTVYYHVKRGTIPTIRIGGRWRIRRDRLDSEFLNISPQEHSKQHESKTYTDDEFIDSIVNKVILAIESKLMQSC